MLAHIRTYGRLTASLFVLCAALPAGEAPASTMTSSRSASASARITAIVPVICRTTVAGASVTVNQARYYISTLCNTRFSATASISAQTPLGNNLPNFPRRQTNVTFNGSALPFMGNTVTLYNHSGPVFANNSSLVISSPGIGTLGLTLAVSSTPEG